jgi:hypothetical protein
MDIMTYRYLVSRPKARDLALPHGGTVLPCRDGDLGFLPITSLTLAIKAEALSGLV